MNSITTNAKHAETKRANVKLRKFILLSYVCRAIVMGGLTGVTGNHRPAECMGAYELKLHFCLHVHCSFSE